MRTFVKKRETKYFIIRAKGSFISKLFKILNHRGNIGKKNFRCMFKTFNLYAFVCY